MDQQWLQQYCRQIALPEVDIAGQQKLASAHVLVLGLGGLGATAALLLAGAGVGTLSLMDADKVSLSNLHRQIGHTRGRMGMSKVASMVTAIEARFGDSVRVISHERFFGAAPLGNGIDEALHEADIVLDCTDQFSSRHAINRACLLARKPLVSAAAVGFEGQLTSFDFTDKASPCYACLYQESVPEADGRDCLSQGVFGPIPSVLGSLQALETCRMLLGLVPTLVGRLLIFDGRIMQFKTLMLPPDPACAVCQSFC